MNWLHKCSCGYQMTMADWLHGFLDRVIVPAGEDGPEYVLELSNCPKCHSTRGRSFDMQGEELTSCKS